MRMITGAEEQVTAMMMLNPALAQEVQHQDIQHHHREGQEHVAREGHTFVPPAAEIAADEAETDADDIGHERRGDPPDEHALTAPERARQDVAAAHVAAQGEPDAWLEPPGATNGAIGLLGSMSGR